MQVMHDATHWSIARVGRVQALRRAVVHAGAVAVEVLVRANGAVRNAGVVAHHGPHSCSSCNRRCTFRRKPGGSPNRPSSCPRTGCRTQSSRCRTRRSWAPCSRWGRRHPRLRRLPHPPRRLVHRERRLVRRRERIGHIRSDIDLDVLGHIRSDVRRGLVLERCRSGCPLVRRSPPPRVNQRPSLLRSRSCRSRISPAAHPIAIAQASQAEGPCTVIPAHRTRIPCDRDGHDGPFDLCGSRFLRLEPGLRASVDVRRGLRLRNPLPRW